MNLNQLKERILDQFKSIWVRIEESSTYEKLVERYHELTPTGQKAVLFGGSIFGVLFILMIPFMSFQTSQENVSQFEENVLAVRDLLRVQREVASQPQVEDPPQPAQLQSMVQEVLSQSGLSNEQIKGNNPLSPERDPKSSILPASVVEQGVEVTLLKLNLKQVTDIGSRLSQIGRNTHLTSIDMRANAQNDHYFDVVYRLMGFTMIAPAPSVSAPPSPDKKVPKIEEG